MEKGFDVFFLLPCNESPVKSCFIHLWFPNFFCRAPLWWHRTIGGVCARLRTWYLSFSLLLSVSLTWGGVWTASPPRGCAPPVWKPLVQREGGKWCACIFTSDWMIFNQSAAVLCVSFQCARMYISLSDRMSYLTSGRDVFQDVWLSRGSVPAGSSRAPTSMIPLQQRQQNPAACAPSTPLLRPRVFSTQRCDPCFATIFHFGTWNCDCNWKNRLSLHPSHDFFYRFDDQVNIKKTLPEVSVGHLK